MAKTISEQEALAARTLDFGYVCLLTVKGQEEWYVVKTTNWCSLAQKWWLDQENPARVFHVKDGKATIRFSK